MVYTSTESPSRNTRSHQGWSSPSNVPIKVEGMVNTITSKNGNISVNGDVLGNVDSKNGNITVAGSIQGDATTKNGNIY